MLLRKAKSRQKWVAFGLLQAVYTPNEEGRESGGEGVEVVYVCWHSHQQSGVDILF